MILPPNTTIAQRYTIKELLGQGAISEVYLVLDKEKNDFKALKLLISYLIPRNYSLPSLMNQVEASFKLNHPNIVAVKEIGSIPEGIFLTMPLIKGRNLKEWMEEENLDHSEALEAILSLISDIGGALQYAHSRGITHRDIKPSNIMLDEKAKFHLLDFGAATFRNHCTGSGNTISLGTPPYYPPEDFLQPGVPVTSIDTYSFAYIIGELLDSFFTPTSYLENSLKKVVQNSRKIIEKALKAEVREKPLDIEIFCKELRAALTEM